MEKPMTTGYEFNFNAESSAHAQEARRRLLLIDGVVVFSPIGEHDLTRVVSGTLAPTGDTVMVIVPPHQFFENTKQLMQDALIAVTQPEQQPAADPEPDSAVLMDDGAGASTDDGLGEPLSEESSGESTAAGAETEAGAATEAGADTTT